MELTLEKKLYCTRPEHVHVLEIIFSAKAQLT